MLQNKRPLIIGITGSIGSGKTSVCTIIEQHYPVYYADSIAHQALEHDSVIKSLINRWGRGILHNGLINRQAISRIVFQNRDELKYLNSVIHPAVLIIMQNIVDNTSEEIVFFEVPLLFETNLKDCFDHIVLIIAEEDVKFNRIMSRDGLDEEEVKARMLSQYDDKIKVKESDTVIYNNGTMIELDLNVVKFIRQVSEIQFRIIKPFFEL